MQNDLAVNTELKDFLVAQYLDKVFGSWHKEIPNILASVDRRALTPKAGDHLVSPRFHTYTHHGIYVGNEAVVHYSGFSDGLTTGPVIKTSLSEFACGRSYHVRDHQFATKDKHLIVERAWSRLNESDYSFIFNNCEHFAYWCVYGKHSSPQVGSVVKVAATSAKKIPLANVVVSAADAGRSIKAYLNNEISHERLLEEISEISISSTSIAYYSILGQAAIPIPVLGSLIGAGIGYMVGNMLNHSGLVALGDSRIVRQAKERRREIELMCEQLIPQIRQSRIELEIQLEKHFTERKNIFLEAFEGLKEALLLSNSDAFAKSLQVINKEFRKSLSYESFSDFEEMMNSDLPMKF